MVAQILFLVPFVVSAFTSLGIAVYAWQRRQMGGAIGLVVAGLAQGISTIFYSLELLADSLAGKVFWDKPQWFTYFAVVAAYYVCAKDYHKTDIQTSPRLWASLSVFPIFFGGLLLLDPWTHLIYNNPYLLHSSPFITLLYDYTPSNWLAAIYAYGLNLLTLGILLRRSLVATPPYSNQAAIMLMGILIPTVGVIITMNNVIILGIRDYTPLTFSLCNLAFFWALFRYRLFDLVPIAYDTVVENLRDAVFVLDLQGRIVDINPAAAESIQRLIQKGRAEVVGQFAKQILPPWFGGNFSTSEEIQYQEVIFEAGEELRHLHLSLMPLHNLRRGILSGSLLVVRDVTAREQAKDTLQQQTLLQERLQREQELNYLKTQFVTIISHEFRTPLAIIATSNYLLKVHWDKLSAEKREQNFAKIDNSVSHLKNIMNDLTLIQDLEQNVFTPNPTEFSLNMVCRTIVQQLEPYLGVSEIKVELPAEDIAVFQDKLMLSTILRQLLSNAAKFSPPQHPIALRVLVLEKRIQVSVHDKGIGIPLEEQNRIFDSFTRASNVDNQRGLGMGLTIAHRMATTINGTLRLESQGENTGTTAILDFPSRLDPPATNFP